MSRRRRERRRIREKVGERQKEKQRQRDRDRETEYHRPYTLLSVLTEIFAFNLMRRTHQQVVCGSLSEMSNLLTSYLSDDVSVGPYTQLKRKYCDEREREKEREKERDDPFPGIHLIARQQMCDDIFFFQG
jgi:hypothetical protein